MKNKKSDAMEFTIPGAILGFIAYLILTIIVVAIFIVG
jgi:hypothetical protein